MYLLTHSLSPVLVLVVVMGSMELKIARLFSCSFSDSLSRNELNGNTNTAESAHAQYDILLRITSYGQILSQPHDLSCWVV